MSGSSSVSLQAKGLHTFVNPLGNSIPQGSFLDVSNVVVDRDGIIEPRRGFNQYLNSFGTQNDRAKQLLNYKDSVLRHVLSELQFDLDSAFSSFTSDAIDEIRSGLRIRSVETNGNLYFVTATGVKKISARNALDFPNISITNSGGAKALDLIAKLNYGNPGFMIPNSKVAYRILWGIKDLNENLILGTPSSSTLVYNKSLTDSAVVDLQFAIPKAVTSTNFFYQVYRTGVFQGDIAGVNGIQTTVEPVDPGDEMYLVFESPISSAELAAGSIGTLSTLTDITSEDFRKNGTLLYTNPTSGEGITQANEIPPFATDIAVYKNYTFYANTKTVQRFNLAFLSSSQFINNSSTFSTTDGTNTNTYTFRGSVETYNANFSTMVASDFVNSSTGPAKYFTLIAANDETKYLVYYYASNNDQTPILSGYLPIQVNVNTSAVTAVQRIVFSAVPASGNYKLSYGALTTGTFAYNDNAATIQAALRLLTGLGSVTVTGDYSLGFDITFTGVNGDATLLAVQDNVLLDTASKAVTLTFATTTHGVIVDSLSDVIDSTKSAILTMCQDFNITTTTSTMAISCANNGSVTISPTSTLPVLFTISKNGLGTGEDATTNKIFLPRTPINSENGPTPAQQLEQIARSLINVINKKDTLVYAYYNSAYNDIPGQVRFEQQDITGPQVFFQSSLGSQFSPALPSTGLTVGSTNEISPNRVYYSKIQQPEAVPLVNYIDIGPRDREIKRIIALRDSLFVFKENGIYRISGESAPFIVQEFDFSAQVLASDTAAVLNNQVYALSTQGVITVSDTGVSVISRPIENLIMSVIKNEYNYKTLSFGVGYETDRAYLLYLPSGPTDTTATQCLRYNIFTSTWTKWTMSATCGIVNFADVTLYIGAGDLNYVEKERKSLTRLDHADREYLLTVNDNGVNKNDILVNSVSEVTINDIVIQEQYLTGSQWDRLLLKLDDDISISDNNYETLLAFNPGDNMRSKLVSLTNKLDLDSGIVYNQFTHDINSYSYSISASLINGSTTKLTIGTHSILTSRYISTNLNSNIYEVISVDAVSVTVQGIIVGSPTTLQTVSDSFQDIQSCFNIIVDILNLDTGAFFTNYPKSIGTIKFESPIIAINKVVNKLTLKTSMAIMAGNITLYKAIHSMVTWNPIFFQDPSLLKQVREGTMLFENSNFSSVNISYSTDLSPSFESITFTGSGLGVGDWGYFQFGTINWGGVAAPIPLRTLIPLEKQRCRYMNVKFEHSVAFEKYAIYGLSLVFRAISSRGYR
ncbi:MAG: hypothetical protein EBZ95_04855 [Chitinophagia bacterium]|nr:hypothetical protein [Chitinophagia bacterium]